MASYFVKSDSKELLQKNCMDVTTEIGLKYDASNDGRQANHAGCEYRPLYILFLDDMRV
jgi:hypothetical protein